MKILGIETSCDETAVAVVEDGRKILANFVYSQVEHSKYGGIVPEIASRQQLKKILPLYQACHDKYPLSLETIDGVAVTSGPGLIGSLMVGLNFAKSLAYSWQLPLLGVNHLEGHIFANNLVDENIKTPFICLLVSGGHTILVKVNDWCDYEILGSTRDDAAGEAFDKVAKLLGLGYPGGYKIDSLAKMGDKSFYKFPIARFKKGAYQFSFSGLKTAVALYLKKQNEDFLREHLNDISASFQETVIKMLVETTLSASENYHIKTIAIGGGVAANSRLREVFLSKGQELGLKIFFPPLEFCTDNAAMIASVGCYRMARGEKSDFSVTATPYLKLG